MYGVVVKKVHVRYLISWSVLVSSFILSCRRLDVYHTSTDDVVLVRI